MSEKKSFDQATFLDHFQDMESLAFEAAASFLEQLPKFTQAIESAIQSKDSSKLEIAAHTLKGVVSNFYAEPSRLLAWKLEQMAHGKMTEDAEKIFRELNLELSILFKELHQLLDEKKPQ